MGVALPPRHSSHDEGSHGSGDSGQRIVAPGAAERTALAAAAERALAWRVLPLLLLVVMVSFIDRTNLSFASITMNADLGFPPSVYGLAAGVFSLGYALGQVPSNIALLRLGAPAWLATICGAWAICAGAFAFVRSAAGFVALRLLLGLCEAGSIPGVWAYVAQMWRPERTTLPLVVIETGITVSQVLGAPLAAGLLALDGAGGLKGWQWVFLAEAAPAVLLAGALVLLLPRSIAAARFLTPAQAAALQEAIARPLAGPVAGGCTQQPPQQQGSNSSSSSSSSWRVEEDEQQRLLEEGDPPGGPRTRSTPGRLQGGGGGGCSGGGAGLSGAEAAAAAERRRARVSAPSSLSMPSGAGAGACDIEAAGGSGGSAAGGGGGDGSVSLRTVLAALRCPIVLYAGVWRILHDVGGTGLLFFTPLILYQLTGEGSPGEASGGGAGGHAALGGGATPARVAALSTVPYLITSVLHLLNGWHSQRSGERRLHLGLCWALGAAALGVMPLAMGAHGSPVAAFVLLVLAHVGLNGANGVQTSWVASFLEGPQKTVGLAVYNTLGQAGSFLGPAAVGALRQASGGYASALCFMGACLGLATAMVLALSEPWARGGAWRWRWPWRQRLLGGGSGGGKGGGGGMELRAAPRVESPAGDAGEEAGQLLGGERLRPRSGGGGRRA